MANSNGKTFQTNLKENELVEKWMTAEHPTSIQWIRPRLGPVRDRENAALLSVTQRYADIIFLEDGVINIVEAKLKPNGGVVGQLLQYRELFFSTPEFSKFINFPIKLAILTPFLAIDVVEFANLHDINYILWDPDPEVRKEIERRKERLSSLFSTQ